MTDTWIKEARAKIKYQRDMKRLIADRELDKQFWRSEFLYAFKGSRPKWEGDGMTPGSYMKNRDEVIEWLKHCERQRVYASI